MIRDHTQSTGEMPLCVVADTMHRMNGFENDDIQTAIKEVACMIFGGIHFEGLSSFKDYLFAFFFLGSAANETVSFALYCIFHNNHFDLDSDQWNIARVPSCYGPSPRCTSEGTNGY